MSLVDESYLAWYLQRKKQQKIIFAHTVLESVVTVACWYVISSSVWLDKVSSEVFSGVLEKMQRIIISFSRGKHSK